LALAIHAQPLVVQGVPWFEQEEKQLVVVQWP
jgi:hypothetical protein